MTDEAEYGANPTHANPWAPSVASAGNWPKRCTWRLAVYSWNPTGISPAHRRSKLALAALMRASGIGPLNLSLSSTGVCANLSHRFKVPLTFLFLYHFSSACSSYVSATPLGKVSTGTIGVIGTDRSLASDTGTASYTAQYSLDNGHANPWAPVVEAAGQNPGPSLPRHCSWQVAAYSWKG